MIEVRLSTSGAKTEALVFSYVYPKNTPTKGRISEAQLEPPVFESYTLPLSLRMQDPAIEYNCGFFKDVFNTFDQRDNISGHHFLFFLQSFILYFGQNF